MSKKKQILELRPSEYGRSAEIEEYTGFECTKCNGCGWLKDWSAKRDDPARYDCDRCGGSGRLKAEVEVRWSAEEKKVVERQLESV